MFTIDLSSNYPSVSPDESNLVNDPIEASQEVLRYVEEWNLTIKQFNGGQVYNADMVQIAQVDYDGRVFNMDGRELDD